MIGINVFKMPGKMIEFQINRPKTSHPVQQHIAVKTNYGSSTNKSN